jgi:hypothetical protein
MAGAADAGVQSSVRAAGVRVEQRQEQRERGAWGGRQEQRGESGGEKMDKCCG